MKATARYFVDDTLANNEFDAVNTADLLGLSAYKEVPGDPVLGGRFKYVDGGWEWIRPCPRRPVPAHPDNLDPPECSEGCNRLLVFRGFDLQRNAIRAEAASMVHPERCSWNLLPGRIGGRPLDYAPCTAVGLASRQANSHGAGVSNG